ncbi:MAG: bifunctional 3,4-dihydroxy-2-butanone-4-phosphate synthase/GTP cyclohydrolase II [Acidimicrobiales bacterium]
MNDSGTTEPREAAADEIDLENPFDSIPDAIAAIGRGEIVVVVDDEDRENEGDLIMAAQFATEEKMGFFVNHTSGVICAPVTDERANDLDLPLMVQQNTDYMRTAFTVSIDYRHGTTTGISAHDRALTLRALVDSGARPGDFARPGHIFPLRARQGGVLKRAGHTEASIDLCVLAGVEPVGVLCEIVNRNGSMARVPDLARFCKEHNLVFVSIADLVRYRRRTEKLVRRVAEAAIPTDAGEFNAVVYESMLDGQEHVAFVNGDLRLAEEPLIRVHSECLTGDIFGSHRCDCGPQLKIAMHQIAEAGAGALVYLRGHEGRGIGLGHKIRAYSLQEEGLDTVDANLEQGLPADSREYGIGAQILVDLGVSKMKLMTNNPAKYGGLDGFGLEITERVPIQTVPTETNIAYLRTKAERMGHLLEFEE